MPCHIVPRDTMDSYAVAEYPDPTFRTDHEAQRIITQRRQVRDKLTARLALSWVAVFALSALFGFVGLPALTLVGMGIMLVLLVPAICLMVGGAAFDCPGCGTKMKRDFAPIGDDRNGMFLICPACRIYFYTHVAHQ